MSSAVTSPTAEPAHGEMSITEHLGELRTRIMRAVGWLILGFIVAFWLWPRIWSEVEQPFHHAVAVLKGLGLIHKDALIQLTTEQAQGGIILIFRIATVGAVVIASPLILAEGWGFIAPGLTLQERRLIGPVLPIVALLFLIGCLFAYYVVFPPMLLFMIGTNSKVVDVQLVHLDEYIALLTNIMLALGAAFELPVLVFILAKIGLVTGPMLSRVRRHAIVVVAILAAVITPTPDAFNMMLMALPLYLLYEVSVLVANLAGAKPAARQSNSGVNG